MIRSEKGMVEIHGAVPELLADLHLAAKSLCRKTDRSLVMPSLMSSMYLCEDLITGEEKLDVKKAIENMKEDVILAIEYLKVFNGFHGDTYSEKDKTATEFLKQLKELGDEEDE